MGDHAGEKEVWRAVQPRNANRLPFQITNRPDSLGAEQLKAADMESGQEHQWCALVQAHYRHRRKVIADIGLAGNQSLVETRRSVGPNVLHISEPLNSQKVLRHVLGSEAEAPAMVHPEPGRFGRPFSTSTSRPHSEQPSYPGQHETTYEVAASGVPVRHGQLLFDDVIRPQQQRRWDGIKLKARACRPHRPVFGPSLGSSAEMQMLASARRRSRT